MSKKRTKNLFPASDFHEQPPAYLSAPASGSVACDQKLIDALMDAAAKLTKAADEATLAGLKVKMSIGQHIRIPGPSCDSVIVEVERVSVKAHYSPNLGRQYDGH